MEKQYGQNPHEIFLGGNYALIDISTTTLHNRFILVNKDSYANTFFTDTSLLDLLNEEE